MTGQEATDLRELRALLDHIRRELTQRVAELQAELRALREEIDRQPDA